MKLLRRKRDQRPSETRVVMTLLVRDEEDIVAANLEFHLAQGVDFVVATDNNSVDGTVDILEQYQKAGVLHLIHEPADDYQQTAWVTRMAHLAASDHRADWVINNDADEFWWPRSGSLATTLALTPPTIDVVVGQRHNALMADDEPLPFYERMVVFDRESANHLGVPLPPKVAHRARPDVVVAQGNHEVHWDAMGDELDDGRIEIQHFPVRSRAQFENKIAKGGAALARNEMLPPEVNDVWRQLYTRQQTGEFDQVLSEIVPDEAAVEAGLASGRYVVDRRLPEFLTKLRSRTVVPGALD